MRIAESMAISKSKEKNFGLQDAEKIEKNKSFSLRNKATYV